MNKDKSKAKFKFSLGVTCVFEVRRAIGMP